MFGPQHPITKDDMKVMRQMFFAGYRMCYHTIQHATALPDEAAVQAIMNAMLEDLQAFFPTSSQLVKNPLGGAVPVDTMAGLAMPEDTDKEKIVPFKPEDLAP